MFGSIGGAELLVILLLALLLFGPRKLPEIGRGIGRALSQFRSASNEFKSSLEREAAIDSLRETQQEIASTGRAAIDGGGQARTEPGAECSTHEPAPQAKP